MKYLVMEIHPAYAVVLDESGRFLKATNFHYQVGETVEDVVELRLPPARRFRPWMAGGLVAVAACLCLFFFGYYRPRFLPYGTLRIQINPDVELSVSKNGRVLDLQGLNEDGQALVEGYDFRGKDGDDAVEDLVERAIEMGYLSQGGAVSITASSEDDDWQVQEEQALGAMLQEHYGDAIAVYLGPAVPEQDTAVPSASSTPAVPPASSVPAVSSPVQPAYPDDDWDDDDDDWDDDWDDDDDHDHSGWENREHHRYGVDEDD